MNDFQRSHRRHFLSSGAWGLSSLALAMLTQREQLHANPKKPDFTQPSYDTSPKAPMRPHRARAMISLWMQGGPSQVDLFDRKPELERLNGETFPGEVKYDNAAQASSKVLASPWKWRNYGKCGMELSELIPHMGSIADDITLIRSMHTGVNNHGQSIRALNTGTITEMQPTLGSWLTYGLGAETDSLPAYMALIDPGQLPVDGVANWNNGYLPSIFQGTVVRPTEPRILNLTPPARLVGKPQRQLLKYLEQLNQKHLTVKPGELDYQARIKMFQLAARMQTSAVEAMDLSQETAETKKHYGMDDPATQDFGARCLIARRLIERGVRFVQVFTQNQFWDHHGRIRTSLPAACKKVDQPSAALVTDLKRRGMLDETIVHWGGEMGRLPVIQNDTGDSNVGRDHNTKGFSMWVAGGGFKAGHVHGMTDEFSHQAVDQIVNHYDYHHTLMHLFGLDHQQLAFEHNGQERKLIETDKSRLVTELLA
ncbi:MAG: DUF1501 domain-containing protein [Planctomycetota bacterium]|nr:DUF1501 domain-containing protein [Planctomycetota bacterium]